MASNLILTKRGRGLMAEDAVTIDLLAKIREGQQVRAVVTVPRNLRHHKLFFALLNTVIKAQGEPQFYPTTESLLDALKLATGHVREVRDLHGKIHFVPASIDFGTLDQVAFSEWFDQAINVVLKHILPHCQRADLEQQVYNMLGEPGPQDYQR